MKEPFVVVGNEELARCAGAPDEGGMVACMRCGGEHALHWAGDADQKARKVFGIVRCGDSYYMAALDGKLVSFPPPVPELYRRPAPSASPRQGIRVFAPLPAGHPIVTDRVRCWICDLGLAEGVRVVLLPCESLPAGQESGCVTAKPAHATCALRGEPCARGIVKKIHDGDAPQPVVTTDGKRWTFAEAGIDGVDPE